MFLVDSINFSLDNLYVFKMFFFDIKVFWGFNLSDFNMKLGMNSRESINDCICVGYINDSRFVIF